MRLLPMTSYPKEAACNAAKKIEKLARDCCTDNQGLFRSTEAWETNINALFLISHFPLYETEGAQT